MYDFLYIGKVFGLTEYQQTTQKAIKEEGERLKAKEKFKVAEERKEKLEEMRKRLENLKHAREHKARSYEVILEYDPNKASIKELFSVQQVAVQHTVITIEYT